MRAIITVIGKDKVGIIANVSNFLYKNNINILDISQTIMQELFTMIMLVDLETSRVAFDKVCEGLNELGGKLGVSIRIQHEDIFNSMHKI